jgi:hypothetical protein
MATVAMLYRHLFCDDMNDFAASQFKVELLIATNNGYVLLAALGACPYWVFVCHFCSSVELFAADRLTFKQISIFPHDLLSGGSGNPSPVGTIQANPTQSRGRFHAAVARFLSHAA